MTKLFIHKIAIIISAVVMAVIPVLSQEPASHVRQHKPAKKTAKTVSIPDSIVIAALPDSIPTGEPTAMKEDVVESTITVVDDSVRIQPVDTLAIKKPSQYDVWEHREVEFNPNPTRAVWMSALFPGLGQIYNRRYWKLPIVVGAYLGLGYATSWNNGMLNDYTRAYRDIMDSDPSTKSYMDFFPPTTKEENLDKTWLTNVLRSRKNFYRRNRDLCVICMIGVYFVAMVDAYVDASLSHFDISPDLAMDVAPAVFMDGRNTRPSVGLVWAFTF